VALFSRELGVDLGTTHIRIAEGQNLLIEEPTLAALAYENERPKIVSYGMEAHGMIGRAPEGMEVVRPLQNGVIADYEVTEALLHFLLDKASGLQRFFGPRLMVTVPYGVTSVEQRAVYSAAMEAGAREVFLIYQPLAAALGIDLPLSSPAGNMVLCLGGGVTEAAVLAMYGIAAAETLRKGGLDLDQAIITYTRRKYGVILGPSTAETLKLRIGAALPMDLESSMEVQGRDQVTGLPRPVTLTTSEIAEALEEPLKEVVELCRRVLEKTPPELFADVIDRGIALCGGGALLRGIDRLLTKSLGVPSYLVDNPLTCTVQGTVRAWAMYPFLRRSLPQIR